ncbi:unnamed protein product (macronuclear) [Paramecium tetraurelia]|uniref:Macro domain-containing protein n=1 Tax=Paramecium tetraurelia TaxID=5888 RepID=A0C1X7_PARTE|nr:uncharacterized protein GSPATT00034271001 [Paramecium tetraurelia]CAK64794.1 unnamed protein product [Paramecium tetraurelia]|eukprot:XP_001432191.1 hypothetical protein (macronuclear) [Paramecium tetraurelia strain d4-2]
MIIDPMRKTHSNGFTLNRRKQINGKKLENGTQQEDIVLNEGEKQVNSNPIPKFKYQLTKQVANDKVEIVEAQDTQPGYEMIARITKENSFDLAYKAKLIDFIEKFYLNGYFQLCLYFPHRLGEKQKNELEYKYKDLQLSIKETQFEKADYLFYKQIYQFKGQEKFGITPALQMLIFDQVILKDMADEAQQSGFDFVCNFNKLQCSIPPPTNTIQGVMDNIQYFVNNIQKKLDEYYILNIETQTKQESNIIYNLVKQYQSKFTDILGTNFDPVIINLKELKDGNGTKYPDDFISQIKQTLKYDKFYLVIEKKDKDLSLFQQEFIKLIYKNNFVQYDSKEISIQFSECLETEILAQQLEDLQEKFKNISITASQPKQIKQNQFEIKFSFETWLSNKEKTYNVEELYAKIHTLLYQIYNPYVQINIEESKICIWQQYLKGEINKSLNEYIEEEDKRMKKNDNQNVFIVKISTKFTKFKEEIQKIKQQLDELSIETIEIQNDNIQLQSLIYQIDLKKILNNFQQQEKEKIAQINYLGGGGGGGQQWKYQFAVIYYNKYTVNSIQNQIKNNFINDLKYITIQTPFIQIMKHLHLEIPRLILEKDIIPIIPQENKQQVILVGRSLDLEQVQNINEEMKELFEKYKMEIRLTINQKSLADQIKQKLQEQQFCTSIYDPKKYMLKIEIYKQDFQNIIKSLKELEKSYEIWKVYHFDSNQIEPKSIKEIEKKEQVIIDVKNISIIDPISAEGFLINTVNTAKIKFIQGNISQIQCQAIVLEFVKNVDFSKEIIQNDQVKTLINFIEGENDKDTLFLQWRYLSKAKDLEDVTYIEFHHQKHLKYLIQVYPKFYRKAANLENYQCHVYSLIAQVFETCKFLNITQIAFPLIGSGVFGNDVKQTQEVLIQGIISQLSLQNCISQVFVVIQNESDYKQVQEYCKSGQFSKKTTKLDFFRETMSSSKNSCCQIEMDGDFMDIEGSDANELIFNSHQQLNQGEEIDNFNVTYPYSKCPFTHSIDLKNNKMIDITTKLQQTIQFIDLFKQRIYFIDFKQVSKSLNQYLIIKHELCKQNEFEIYYTQDQVIIKNKELYIKTNGFNDLKKVIITQRPSSSRQTNRQSSQYFQLTESPAFQPLKNDPKLQKLQIEILSDNEQKILRAYHLLKQAFIRRT